MAYRAGLPVETSTVLPASAAPASHMVLSLVMSSKLDVPLSGETGVLNTGAAGAAVSTVTRKCR